MVSLSPLGHRAGKHCSCPHFPFPHIPRKPAQHRRETPPAARDAPSGQDAAVSLRCVTARVTWARFIAPAAQPLFYISEVPAWPRQRSCWLPGCISTCARADGRTGRGMPLLPPPPRPLSWPPILINNYRQLKDLFIPKGLPFIFLRGSAQGDTMIIRLTRHSYSTMSL